jgi:hypothetical protein
MHIWQPKICETTKLKFMCEVCDYTCSRQFLLNQHFNTLKHKNKIKQHLATPKYAEQKFACDNCDKSYKQRSGLWRHKKKCLETNIKDIKQENKDLKNLMETILTNLNNNNNTVKNELLDQLKIQSTIIQDIIPRIGNNNNKFNINVFLNEKCKNAVNMTDFIDSLQIKLKDIDYTKNNGLINGISSLFINNLKQMDKYERPIHCTDVKRETIYIKDNNNWEKDMDKHKIKEVITELTNKQRQKINEWKDNNPSWKDNENKKDEYISLVKTLMDDIDNNNIIKNIAKHTLITESNR